MTWQLDKSKALCPQICQHLCAQIASGALRPGEKVASVREVAVAAGVNPNTVQNAFNQLEQQGVLYSVRGAGWFVNQDTSSVQELQEKALRERIDAFFAELTAMGLPPEKIKKLVEEWEYDCNLSL